MQKYTQAPLPFQGQKRMFLKQFTELINKLPNNSTIVDLFGGSGLLSHTAKQLKPKAKVIYNDFDNYTERLQHIPQTNELLQKLSVCCLKYKDIVLYKEKISQGLKLELIKIIKQHQRKYGYIDFYTLSTNVLFSGKIALDLDELKKETFYNRIVKKNYSAKGYLDGVIVERLDYKQLFEKYKNAKNLFLITDPPYLSTDTKSYKSDKYWKITDYLDVLDVLENQKYVYFSSNKSEVIELCNWLSKHDTTWKNPFAKATIQTRKNHINQLAKYTDIMLYKI